MSTGEGISVGETVEEAFKKYFTAISAKIAGNQILYIHCEQKILEAAAALGVEMIRYQSENDLKDPDQYAGVYCTENSEAEINLRQWAIRHRKHIFTQAETFVAYLESKKATAWNVKPMGEWLNQKEKGVAIK